MALFENYEGRMPQIQPVLDKYGFKDFEDVKAFNNAKGVDAYKIVESTQPICFENAKWAYELGAAIAMKEGVKTAAEAARLIGVGLQAFCIPGSVADQRQVGIGHGNLGARLLEEETECFAFLAGHESFAAAEGAIKIALDKDDQVCGYQFLSLGKMMDAIKKGMSPNEAYEKNIGTYGRFKAEDGAVKWIDPRKE